MSTSDLTNYFGAVIVALMGYDTNYPRARGFVQNDKGEWIKPKTKKDEPARIAPENALKTAVSILDQIHSQPKRKSFTVNHAPSGAPRMTRQDKWLKPRRPCVEKYFQLRAAIQAAVGPVNDIPDRIDCTFYLAMPDSWSDKKKAEMEGKPHRVRPDRDNMEKAVMDSLFVNDGGIHEGFSKKVWCHEGFERIEITMWFFPS